MYGTSGNRYHFTPEEFMMIAAYGAHLFVIDDFGTLIRTNIIQADSYEY